ncbi:nucleolar complex protein 4 homolog B [Drosophila mojavensis]|uniref:CCAAT-binding factor domain-containing protein n=1 Tax=Drosophila mojavensis TaxID=7230 RepID=B4L494_DROMO|nr:nucleolar complex protein 4 homolog B [Drosophila mojavensis]EDW07372.1 uncharacterized protein Dmoj_GI14900 [Drosophila mojavensis]
MKQNSLDNKSGNKQAAELAAKRANVPAALQQKANDFLNSSPVNTKALKQMVNLLENPDSNAVGIMYVLEVIFRNLLKRKLISTAENKKCKGNAQAKPQEPNATCQIQYNKAWSVLLANLGNTSKEEAGGALKVCMQLIAAEAKHSSSNAWPVTRLRSILEALINAEATPTAALAEFAKFTRCLDVLQFTYQLLPGLAPKSFVDTPNLAFNYLAIINVLDLGKTVLNDKQFHIGPESTFDYERTRQLLNKVWSGVIASCNGVDEKVHRQVLVVLLERILPHLKDPILLTDFLMDSLHQFDGPIALLALQGIFTLMQKQNITYPDVYQKLYNMFYPRMFYNKYKARLFYLADIFLTSTHLPENLVAAFAKRLARLALKSPTEDAIIMIRFICNLLLRHTGLQRLICATGAASGAEIVDPYDETELDPVKAGALQSSLWELVLLQKHAVPEVANAAKFINKSLPMVEFDLSSLLEIKECNIFDDEVKKEVKQFTMAYERPTNFALPQYDIVTKYWDIL